jgi:CubicO group peptidase (beta-lactamase class C family)
MSTIEARLGSLFEALERDRGFSGAVLVSQEAQTVFEGVYGFASRQLNVRNAADTRFHIASVTKMFIAMAALTLVEEGRIRLDERPATYLPALSSLDERITLHHLLSHTSGVADVYDDVPNAPFEALKARNGGSDLLTYLASQPQKFEPGDGWSYSSTGYLLVGYVLEHVTGSSFETLLRDRVLVPLAMTNTGVDRLRRINRGRAYGHTFADGHFVNADNDALSPFDDGPGELYSTVGDLKLWCDALFSSPPFSASTLQLMFAPHARIDADRSYGYGWFLEPPRRTHGGHTPGFFSRITQIPEQELSLILLMNASHIGPDPIIEQMETLVAEA